MSVTGRRWSINIITETMFPGVEFDRLPPGRPARPSFGHELVSSLPLQMALYFNILFVPCWAAVLLVVFNAKFDRIDFLSRYIHLTVLAGVILMEVVRLYVGYMGNLREHVPDLAGFWLITLLLACPLHGILLLNTWSLRLAPEVAVVAPQVVFVVVELALGYTAVRQLARHQVARFHAANAARANQPA